MNAHTLVRRACAASVVAGASVLALSVSAAASAPLYCGGGRGPTADVAIASAIDDAQNSASGDGLFTCVLVGEPQVFQVVNDPLRGTSFRAQVNMACTP